MPNLVQLNDFSFLGSFRLPTTDGNGRSTTAGAGLALRYVQGQPRLLTTSHSYAGGMVYETDVPTQLCVNPIQAATGTILSVTAPDPSMQNAVWLQTDQQDSQGRPLWCLLKPDGTVWQWDRDNNAFGAQVGTLAASYYANPAPLVMSTANVRRYWGDVYGGHKWLDGPDDGSGALPGAPLSPGNLTYGLYWDPNAQRLYWNYGHWYNPTNNDNPCVGYATLDDATGVATGVAAYRLQDAGCKAGCGGTLNVPQWFADQYLGAGGHARLAVGHGGYYSALECGHTSAGPCLLAVPPPDPAANPDKSYLPTQTLLWFPWEQDGTQRGARDAQYTTDPANLDWPAPAGGVGSFQWTDCVRAAAWIDTPTKSALLTLAKVGRGYVHYAGSNIWADTTQHVWQLFDPADLGRVATGQLASNAVRPYATGDIPPTMCPNLDQRPSQGEGFSMPDGAAWDAQANRLYVRVGGGYFSSPEYYPLVSVFGVGP